MTTVGVFELAPRFYDVGVTSPHSSPVEWALQRGMRASVRAHALGVQVPAGIDLEDRALADRAISHYSAACASCHGAPGHPAAPWMVLYPPAPDLTLAESESRWTDAELYWILENGIKDTGMLALGPTHQPPDIWAVAAFVRQLPEMTPERYHELLAGTRGQSHGARHAINTADPLADAEAAGGAASDQAATGDDEPSN